MSAVAKVNDTARAVDQMLDLAAKDAPERQLRVIRLRALYAGLTAASENSKGIPQSWGASVTQEGALKLLAYCTQYDLEPGNDVMLMGDNVYVRPDGRRKLAHRDRDDQGKKTFAGFKSEGPMTAEQVAAYGMDPENFVGWVCEIVRNDCQFPFAGFGFARKDEFDWTKKKSPIQMAQARAHGKGFRLAYPTDMPSEDDAGEFIDVTGSSTVKGPAPATSAPNPVPDDLAAERSRFKALEGRNKKVATNARHDHGLGTAPEAAAATAEQWRALNDDIADRLDDPAGPTLRQEAAKLRVSHPEEFAAKLEEARKVRPHFDPELARTNDLEAFLAGVRTTAGA